jgi:hypothetical protein
VDVQEVCDRQEISDLVTRYTRAVDIRSYAGLSEVFTADAVLDYTDVGGPCDVRDTVVAWIEKGLAGFDRFQHVLGQVAIEFEPAPAGREQPVRARATAYFTNPMVGVAPGGTETLWEVGGYYHHTVARTEQGWRSVALREEIVWTR